MYILSWIIISAVLLVSLYTDIKSFKIKNIVTIPMILIATVIGFFVFPIMSVVSYFLLLFAIGIAGWLLRMWKAGDLKISVAIGMWSMFILGKPDLKFAAIYYLIFILFHLAIGHFFILKSCKFNPIQYVRSLVTPVNIVYGRIPATFTIIGSFILVMLVSL